MPTTLSRNPTSATIASPGDPVIDLACETLYRFLAAALTDPRAPGAAMIFDGANGKIASEAADLIRETFRDDVASLGFGELPLESLDLRPMLRELPESPQRLRDEYARVFGLVTCRECPPYETEYCTIEDTFARSQQMADIAGFYRAFGLEPAGGLRERPDHVALELEFEALLLTKARLALNDKVPDSHEHGAICLDARAAFFRDHLGWWGPSFATGLRRKADSGFYAAAGGALAAFLAWERHRLKIPPATTLSEPAIVEPADDPNACAGCSLQTLDPPLI